VERQVTDLPPTSDDDTPVSDDDAALVQAVEEDEQAGLDDGEGKDRRP
jgi:hypothetical protein